MTATQPLPAATTDTWSAQLEQLKGRYKHVRQPVLVALNILLHDQNIATDDAKAQAALHGTRITAASVNAAKTLLSRMDSPTAATVPAIASPPAGRTAEQKRAPRRPRAGDAPLDAEALIRGFVSKLQGQGNAEAERLREAVRKAIAVLQAALG